MDVFELISLLPYQISLSPAESGALTETRGGAATGEEAEGAAVGTALRPDETRTTGGHQIHHQRSQQKNRELATGDAATIGNSASGVPQV